MECYSDPAWGLFLASTGIGFAGTVAICGLGELAKLLWSHRPASLRRDPLRQREREMGRLRRLSSRLNDPCPFEPGTCPTTRGGHR